VNEYEGLTDRDTVVVAMSGGVDSSVAALLLHQQGVPCIGVSMQVWDYRNSGGCSSRATCCAPDDFTDARKVAARVGIPYYVFDFERSFRREVIDNFVATYARGETPNPCVDCNNKVKFHELRERARQMNCRGIATGHYAKIASDPATNMVVLLRGDDREKDQSYFLYGTPSDQLAETFFPVGHLSKQEVRAIAAEFGLTTASKPESQDICFVSGSVQDFLVKIGMQSKKGLIRMKDGTIVGEHDGIQNYTVGQRRGLGLGGAAEPLYVIEIDPGSNTVFVGSRSELEKNNFLVVLENVLSSEFAEALASGTDCVVQVRHRHAGTAARVKRLDSHAPGQVLVELSEPLSIAPGQAAVMYCENNERVLGGGRITPRPVLAAEHAKASDHQRTELAGVQP
jgi:tRNA-specific 2-thiouridylase